MYHETAGKQAELALPAPERRHPLLYRLALQADGERLGLFNGTVMSSISLTSGCHLLP